MDVMIRFLVLLVLGVLGTSSSRQLPRNLEAMNYPEQESGYLVRNDRMCTLCKEYAATALDYLSKNKTQREIIELLRISCTQLGAFKPECVAFVDHYAPLLLSEISSIEPDDFCKKVSLCKEVIVTDIFTDRGGWL